MNRPAITNMCLWLLAMLLGNSALVQGVYWTYQYMDTDHQRQELIFGPNVDCLYGLSVPDIVKNMSNCGKICKIGEKNDLMGLYRETNGDHWLKQKHWLSNTPYCDWEGILCDDRTGHVIAINLENNGMKGTVGANLGQLEYLFGACLEGNQLTDEVTELLGTFRTYLLRFDVTDNQIWGSFPRTIEKYMPLLTKLQLSGNTGITGHLPPEIGMLKKLQVLSIGKTGVRGSIPTSIGSLKELYYLDFAFLRLEGSLTLLKNLTRLKYIHLMSNQISGNIPVDFGQWFPELIELNLQNNVLSGIIPSSLGNLTKLELINLATNRQLSGELPTSLRFLTTLRIIDLSYTNLTGLAKGFYFNSTSLSSFIAVNTPNFACSAVSLIDALNVKASRTSLMQLNVQESGIYGRFDILSFSRMTFLNLGGNRRLSGTIPDLITSLSYLVNLNISYGNLTGSFPASYLGKLEMLAEVDLRGNPLMKGDLDPFYLKVDTSNLIKENPSDPFSCPAIRFKQNNALVRIDASYYDRQFCHCDVGYYGLGGHCRMCLKPGGQCYNRSPTFNTSSINSTFGNYIATYLRIEEGYWPFPNPNNVASLLKCPTFNSGKTFCNPNGLGKCFLEPLTGNSSTEYKTGCNKIDMCLKGHRGRLCGVCKEGYYKNGIECRTCPVGNLKTKEIIGIAVTGIMLMFSLMFILLFFKSKAVPVVSFVVLEVLVVLLMASFEIAPNWLAEINILLVFLGLVGFAKTSKGFLKICFVYIQVIDALIVTSHIWPEAVYKAQTFISSAFNLRFSSIACQLPMLFTPQGRLLCLLLLPFTVVIITWLFYGIWYIVKGRNDNDLDKIRRYQWRNFCISFLNVLYFPLAMMVLSVFSECQEAMDVSFMKSYVWIDCGSKEYTLLVILAGVVTPIYIFPGFPAIFAFLLYQNRNKIKEQDTDVQNWLGSLYMSYKTEYRLYMEVLLMLKRLGIAAILSLIPDSLDRQTFLITTILVLFIAFESHTKPFKTSEDQYGSRQGILCGRFWRKANKIGLENIVEISSLCVMLISFVAVRFKTVIDYTNWNTPLFWIIVILNILVILWLFIGIIIRVVTREQNIVNEDLSEDIHSLVDKIEDRSYSSLLADEL